MIRHRLGMWVAAFAFCGSAVAAAPQYALIDLGSVDIAGAGLPWKPLSTTSAPTGWPSISGGTLGAAGGGFYYATYNNVYVGASPGPNHTLHAAKWTVPEQDNPVPVTVTDIGLLPGAAVGQFGVAPFSIGIGFSDIGDVTGEASTSYASVDDPGQLSSHAFLYQNGQIADLGSIAGPNYNSSGHAVNDSGEVVGVTDTISTATGGLLDRAFVYTNGTMYNVSFYLTGELTSVRLTDAWWIDCQGNIAAIGTPATGATTHNYLLIRQGPARTCPQ